MTAAPGSGRTAALVATLAWIVAVVLLAGLAPEPAVLGAGRLVATAVLGLGAWLVVGRVGAADLALAATVGAGAVVGGIGAAEAGVPGLLAVPVAGLAGGALGAAAGAVGGRVGRAAGALGTLAVGTGAVALARGISVTGGRSGFHAVPLLVGGDRTDLVAIGLAFVVAAVAVVRLAGSRLAAAAAVAVASPAVSRSFGRRPVADLAAVGAGAGAVLGVGGLLVATRSGSLAVDGFGADLLLRLLLVALLAERLVELAPRLGPAVSVALATAVVHGPGVVLPLVPVVGTASPVLTMGPVVLVVLVVTGRRRPAVDAPSQGAPPEEGEHPGPVDRLPLVAAGLAVPAGTVDVEVAPGEVVALVGPNGAGKSTVLARIAGQLHDGGGVELGGLAAPHGPRARARAGLGRTWQRAPEARPADVVVAAGGDPAAAAWAAAVLGDLGDAGARAMLVAVAARRPGLVVLDEPAALLPADRVGRFLRGLADAGAGVLVVEHRPEVVAVADRRVEVHR